MYDYLIWLAIAAFSFLVIGLFIEWRKLKRRLAREPGTSWKTQLHRFAHEWTWFDTLMSSLFVLGILFLLVDLVAVIRDREQYPMYRLGYLISAFGYTFFAAIFLWVRLFILLKLKNTSSFSPRVDEQTNPHLISQTEDRGKPEEL
jgi:hypothetical protein